MSSNAKLLSFLVVPPTILIQYSANSCRLPPVQSNVMSLMPCHGWRSFFNEIYNLCLLTRTAIKGDEDWSVGGKEFFIVEAFLIKCQDEDMSDGFIKFLHIDTHFELEKLLLLLIREKAEEEVN